MHAEACPGHRDGQGMTKEAKQTRQAGACGQNPREEPYALACTYGSARGVRGNPHSYRDSSWMNMVERFFAELTADVVRRGSFQSVRELIRSIEIYLVARNEDPKPYKWKAEGEEILAKVKRARDVLATVS